MALPVIAALAPVISDVLDRFFPDKEEAARAKSELERELLLRQYEVEKEQLLMQKDINLAQAQTNTAEASTDLFRGGWRPFVGWVCGTALAYQYLIFPIFGAEHQLQSIPTEDLMWLLTGMLGLGGLRTFEKYRGVSK